MQVYKITNLVSGKVYIGATKLSLACRFAKHVERAHQGNTRELYVDMRDLGEQAFSIECLANADSWEELYKLEAQYIDEYDAVNSGYNTRTSAPAVEDWEEVFALHKDAMQRADTRAKISQGMKRHIAKFGFSELHRKRLSEAATGKKLSAERRLKCDTRSIGCYCILEDGTKYEFHSYRDAWQWWSTHDNPFSTNTECVYQRKIKQSIKCGYYTYGRSANNVYTYPKWFKQGGDVNE